MIDVKQIDFKNWGRCVSVSNGSIELISTLDFGPRIIYAGFIKRENNFMFEDENNECAVDISAGNVFKEKSYKIAGGHRLWCSPEAMPRSYYPDSTPVTYEKTDRGVILTSDVQEKTNIQLKIEISMCEKDDKVTLSHFVTNVGMWGIKLAPWCLTMLAKGGFEVIPQNDAETGLLSNRRLELWPYTKMTDERIYWGDKYLTLRQDENVDGSFKVGMGQDYPYAAYFLNGEMFLKQYDVIKGAEYPDNGCTFETYTCPSFLEMESLGEYKVIEPNETAVHTEKWSFYQDVECPGNDEEKIELTMKRYV